MGQIWRSLSGRGTAVLVLALLLLGAGLAWSYLLVAGLGACLLVLVVGEVAAVALARTVTVSREIDPRVVTRQAPCEGRLSVTGRRRRGVVRLDVADRVDGALVLVQLPDRHESDGPAAQVSYPIPTKRRGLLDVGPVEVRLTGLTGMAARSTESGSIDQVRVLPRKVPVSGMLPGHRRALTGGDESYEIGGTDLVGLHEYSMGDDLRRLHWATSARTGRLMVREDAEPSQAHLCVLLDDRAASYLGDDDLFEEAVELAAALCRGATDRGDPVRLHTLSDRREVDVPGSVTRRALREHQDLDWTFAEIDLTDSLNHVVLRSHYLDVAVAVTGPGSDLLDLGLTLGEAPTRVIAVVESTPGPVAQQGAGVLVLRGPTSLSLASSWDAVGVR